MKLGILLLLITHMCHVTSAPSDKPIMKPFRQKKAPNYPYQYQIVVPNLQVIPIQGHRWSENGQNGSRIVVPISNFVPMHEIVAVNRLAVVPLQRKETGHQYRGEERYRKPIGGFGVGWRFGGHGAGHGFYYGFG